MSTQPTKSILAEQLLLAKAEKQIQGLIEKINGQLNELLVKNHPHLLRYAIV